MQLLRMVVVLACVCVVTISQAAEREFLFCYEDQDFAPFVLGTTLPEQGEGGILIDFIEQAAAQSGLRYRFIRQPWKRCQAELAEGLVDALFAFIYTPERATWAAFPMTDGEADDRYFYLSEYRVYVQPDSVLSWDGQTLLPATAIVQATPGYIAEQRLQAMGFQPVTDLQPDQAFPLMALDRLDGYVLDSVIADTLIEREALGEQITRLELPFMTQPWYVVFSQQRYQTDSDTIERFWSALKDVRQTQQDALVAKYQNLHLPGSKP